MAGGTTSGTLKIWNRGEPGFVPEGPFDVEPRPKETGWECSFKIACGSLTIVRWEPEPDAGAGTEIEEFKGELKRQIQNNQKKGVVGKYDWELCVLDVRCLRCGEILFKETLMDGKNWGMLDEPMFPKVDLKSDGSDHFYWCQRCGAKNIVVKTPKSYEGEPPQFKIVSWK